MKDCGGDCIVSRLQRQIFKGKSLRANLYEILRIKPAIFHHTSDKLSVVH